MGHPTMQENDTAKLTPTDITDNTDKVHPVMNGSTSPFLLE